MLNISILSISASLSLLSNSPLFANNQLSVFDSNFQRFQSILFYNQNSLRIDMSIFKNGLGNIIINENVNSNELQTIQNHHFASAIKIEDNVRSISIINCQFAGIITNNIINISNREISIYITPSTFTSCKSNDVLIQLKKARCLTMTHVCTYDCGNVGTNNDAGILIHDVQNDDFSLL